MQFRAVENNRLVKNGLTKYDAIREQQRSKSCFYRNRMQFIVSILGRLMWGTFFLSFKALTSPVKYVERTT
jgi:hypothetical protein